MDFIQQLKAFDEIGFGNLTPNAIAIYYHLFHVNNRTGWKEWFTQSDYWIGQAVGIKRNETILSAINLLKQKGFIDFVRGTKRNQPTQYKIIPLDIVLNNSTKTDVNIVQKPMENRGEHSTKTDVNIGAILNNKHKQKLKPKQVNNKGQKPDVFAGESERVQEALRAFLEMRTKMRKPMTDRAKELLLSKLEDLSGGDEFMKVRLLEQSIERGWQSVFPLKGELSTTGQKTKLEENMEAAERAIAMLRREEEMQDEQGY